MAEVVDATGRGVRGEEGSSRECYGITDEREVASTGAEGCNLRVFRGGVKCAGTMLASCSSAARIQALAWLEAPSGLNTKYLLLAGDAKGALSLYTHGLELILSAQIHHSPVLRIHARQQFAGTSRDDFVEDVSLVFKDAVVRITVLDLQAAIWQQQQRTSMRRGSCWIDMQKWKFSKSSETPLADGFCAGLMPPSLHHDITGRQGGRKLCLIIAGCKVPLSSFLVSDRGGQSNQNPIVSAVTSVGSSVLNFAASPREGFRNILMHPRFNERVEVEPNQGENSTVAKVRPADEDASVPKLYRSLIDEHRKVLVMKPAPHGPWFLTTDSLGRVILGDALTLTTLRIWKGYRNADADWMVVSDEIFVVIYAPHRRAVEIWRPLSDRVRAWKCAEGRNFRLVTAIKRRSFEAPQNVSVDAFMVDTRTFEVFPLVCELE